MTRWRRRAESLDRAKGGIESVFVHDVELPESEFFQHIHLPEQRARRVFALDVGENVLAIFLVADVGEVLAVAAPHHVLHAWDRLEDQIRDPEGAAGFE